MTTDTEGLRAGTYPGIADAMAQQWVPWLLEIDAIRTGSKGESNG